VAAPSPQTNTPAHRIEKILTSRAALEGEPEQVTVLCVDIVGVTTLAEQRDPEEGAPMGHIPTMPDVEINPWGCSALMGYRPGMSVLARWNHVSEKSVTLPCEGLGPKPSKRRQLLYTWPYTVDKVHLSLIQMTERLEVHVLRCGEVHGHVAIVRTCDTVASDIEALRRKDGIPAVLATHEKHPLRHIAHLH
jgi:hypothetical protein